MKLQNFNAFASALALTCTVLVATPAVAQDALQGKPESEAQKFSYALGFRIASQIKGQAERDNVDIDLSSLMAAMQDALGGADPRITVEEMEGAMRAQSEKMQAKRAEEAAASVEVGQKFQDEFAAQDGVIKTESGLLYKVMVEGEGDMPTPENTVVVNYAGTLPDGTEFDSSYKRGQPATFKLGGIIPGWQEVLQLMKPGSTYEVVIPSALGYGERGSPPTIPPNATLKFKIELIEVK